MDAIKAKCNEDIIKQFAIKKHNEGVVAERQRIASLLSNKPTCPPHTICLDADNKCYTCWMCYLSPSAEVITA